MFVNNVGNIQISDSNDSLRAETVTIHGNSSFQNLYPDLQPPAGFQPSFSSVANATESSIKPTILRKRPAETTP